jgi:hypothetical protein
MTKSPILSLLENLSASQIEDLIRENKLLQDGFRFYYTVDHFDINKYCFPGGILGDKFERTENGTINYELETDIITAYEEFFSNINANSPVFLLDEYTPEFIGLRDKIIEYINKSRIFNYANTFYDYLKGLTFNSNIKEDFTLFIAITTGLLKNGAQRYNSLINNEYFLTDQEDLGNIEFTKLLESILLNSRKIDSFIVDKIYDTYKRKRPEKFNSNNRIDSEAISRLIFINNLLIKDHSDAKILFLFLSTARSSREIFRNIRLLLPIVHGIPFNFHRTVEQLFLNRLIQDLDYNDRLERLEWAKSFTSYREDNLDFINPNISDDPIYKELETSVILGFQELREQYVTLNLSRKDQFDKTDLLYDELRRATNNMNTGHLKKLYSALKNSSQHNSDANLNIAGIRNLENAFEIGQTFILVFKRCMRNILNGQPITISRGRDEITGTGQHLPIVYRTNIPPHEHLLDELAVVYLDQFAFYSIRSENSKLIVKLQELTQAIFANDFKSVELHEKLIFCLYLLIFPETKLQRNKTNDDYVEDFLLDLFNQSEETLNEFVQSDYIYAVSWILRRNTKYPLALDFANRGLNKFPEDARFYHSRFLIQICLVANDEDEDFSSSAREKILEDIKSAQKYYPLLLNLKTPIIKMNIEATLLNSEIYIKTELLAHSGESSIRKAKELALLRKEQLANLKKLAGSNYNNYPEFLHTEAYFELIESDFIENAADKKYKLDCAYATLCRALEISNRLNNFKTKALIDLKQTLEERNK